MALPSSGVLKWSAIQTEFGGTNPIKLSEYYGRDTLPSSGLIKASDFYGTSDTITLTSWGTLDSIPTNTGYSPPGGAAAQQTGSGLYYEFEAAPQDTYWQSSGSATFQATGVFAALPDITSADAGKTLRGPAVFSISVGGTPNSNGVRGTVSGPVSSSLNSPTQPGVNSTNVTVAFTISAANGGTLTGVNIGLATMSATTFFEASAKLILDNDPTKFTVS
jgi:hypothetical protein